MPMGLRSELIPHLPSSPPSLGDLMKEEEILEWVIDLHESTADVIESVDRKTLQVLINDVEHLAVFFCKRIVSCYQNRTLINPSPR